MSRHNNPTIAIVGAGLGGVACAVNLARAGIKDYTVFEKADGPGGVWWYNDYPGCEVDVNSQAYSYSFMPYVWRRTHATQAEVLQYVEDVIDHFDIRPRFRFGTAVSSVRWDDEIDAYWVDTDEGQTGPFDVVVSCVGMLSTPSIPDWADFSLFRGPMFHSSSFAHDVDLAGKRVALVGTGSSACQLAPALAERAEHLDVYQREPGYVLPKRARDFTADEQDHARSHPWTQKRERWRLLRQAAKDYKALDVTTEQQEKLRSYHAHYLTKTVNDPQVRDALLPSYPYGCKRPVFASDYYPAFNRPDVNLIPVEVAGVTETGLEGVDGVRREADVIVLATGFQAANYLAGLTVTGRNGRVLSDVWAGEPFAFMGMTVPDFPNFFILYGPNTNGGWSVCAQLERQSELLTRVAKRLSRRVRRTVDTRAWAEQRYDRWVQRSIHRRRSATDGGCHNYYRSASGKNVTQWPYGHFVYACLIRLLPVVGLKFNRVSGRNLTHKPLPSDANR
jgi:cation diffusion facilitator CzcD-associated flavoprotein CzcO